MKKESMSSPYLKKKFKTVYEEFFGSNDLVVSGCFLFPWGPIGVGHRSKYIRLKSKIPLKMYTGVKLNDVSKIRFNSVFNYNNSTQNFEEIEFNKINKKSKEITEIIISECQKIGFNSGLDISILTEGPRGHGLGFTGNFGATFAISLYLISGKIKLNDLENYEDFLKSAVFKQISLFARKIDFVSRDGNSIGENSLYSFLNSSLPMIVYSEQFTRDLSIDELENIHVEYSSLDKLFDDQFNCDELPLDYAIVFSGLKNDSSKIEQYTKADEVKYNNLGEFVDKYLNKKGSKKYNYNSNKFIKDYKIYDLIGDNFAFLNIGMLEKFHKIFNQGHDRLCIAEFIGHINVFRSFMNIIEKSNSFPDEFIKQFENLKTGKDEMVGIMPIYSGKIGGGYVVVMDYGTSRNTFEKTIESLKKQYCDINTDYVSWIDGTISDGVIVEQYVSKTVFSDYLSKDKVVYKNAKGEVKYVDYNEHLFNNSNGLILDMIEKKIYLKGKKLTSKDLVSQSSTIEVLELLINNLGEEISSEDLPYSSYSKNKNQMLGKIILPFLSFVQDSFGEKIPLVCKGSQNSFILKLEKTNLEIGVIKKIS